MILLSGSVFIVTCWFLDISLAALTSPDLHWSFDEICSDLCKLCYDSNTPNSQEFRFIGDPCSEGAVTEGIIGNAVSLHDQELRIFNATESCITALDSEANGCKEFTLTFWMNVQSVPADNGLLFKTAHCDTKLNSVGICVYVKRHNNSAFTIRAEVQTSGVLHIRRLDKGVPINRWIHFALVLKPRGGNLEIFLNGTLGEPSHYEYDDKERVFTPGDITLGHNDQFNVTLDEIKIWFFAYPPESMPALFLEAGIDPADFTTTPLPKSTEKLTTTSSTTTSTTTTSRKTTTTTSVSTTTRPLYATIDTEELKNVSQEIYDTYVSNEQTDFEVKEELEDSSNKTIEVFDKLKDIIKVQNITLPPDVGVSYISAVSETTNAIVDEKNADTWKEVEEEQRTIALNMIIENADNTTNAIVESITPPVNMTEIHVVQKQSVKVMFVPPDTEERLIISPTDNVEIALPLSTVTSLSQNTPVVVATNVHTGAEACYDEISPSAVDIADITQSDVLSEDSQEFVGVKLQIITEIVSVNIKPKPVNETITLIFRHVRNITNIRVLKRYCAYIDKLTNRWTNHKCNLIQDKSNETHTTFVSDHLTNFAILMQIVDFEISERDRKNLSLITHIGLSISIFCLVLSLCVFVLVNNIRGHRTERYHLHGNLALGMLLGQVTFLAGAGYPPGTDSCKAAAILLHFFYLSAFSWMLVEGLHLYNLVVKVFRSGQSKLGYYYMIGWGIPLLICVISVSAAFSGYGEHRNCWLDIDNSRVIWAFVGPALLVVLINTIILIKVTRVITTLAKSNDNCIKCMTDKATLVICAKAVAVLMPILGVTWVFGVIAVNQETIVFQYAFAIFNSLQGFFLFMFHCVFNSETRASLIYRTKSLRTEIGSRSAVNSGRRRQAKVELVNNAEQLATRETERILNPDFQAADNGSMSSRHGSNRRRNSQTVPTTSRQTSTTSSNTSSNRDSRSFGQGSAKIQTRRFNPNVTKAW